MLDATLHHMDFMLVWQEKYIRVSKTIQQDTGELLPENYSHILMTMVSILTRYKGSRDSRGSSTSNHKRSSLPYAPGTAVRLFGSGAKNRNGVRPLRSRVLTICHNIFNDYSVLWTRTKSGGYVRTRRLSLEVSFCDKYTIGEKLGSGGFGTVYAAVRNSNGAKARRIKRRETGMELLL